MFDPQFHDYGGLLYIPQTDSFLPAPVAPTSVAPSATAKVKGREYSLADYENLKYEINNQTNILGVNHQASFSNKQDEIIDDMAKQLASYGVSSLKDLTENKYTVEERDPYYFDDGEAPMVTVEKKEVINSKTGEVIPLNELNNSAGSGFTWYKVDFVDGQAVPYAWKEATGAGALGDQIQNIVSIPPVAAALAAVTAGALKPGAETVAKSLLSADASAAAIKATTNAIANAAATTAVTSAATGDLGTGLQAGGTVLLSAGINELKKEGITALEQATGLDLSVPKSTGSLLDTGADSTDYSFLDTPTPQAPVVAPTPDITDFNTDVEAQAGGFYGNTPTAEYDPRLGGTYLTVDGKDVFIPNAEVAIQPSLLETPAPEVLVTAQPTSLLDIVSPVLTDLLTPTQPAPVPTQPEPVQEVAPAEIVPEVIPETIPEVVVTAPETSLLDVLAPVILPVEPPAQPEVTPLPPATTIPEVVVTATQPTTTDLVAPVIPGLLDTNVAPSVTPVMPTSETITPTVTVTGTQPTTVDVVAPVVSTLTPPETPPKTPPETPTETPVTPSITLPTITAEPQQVSRGYAPRGSVSYESLLSLLAPRLQTLPYASAYRRGLL